MSLECPAGHPRAQSSGILNSSLGGVVFGDIGTSPLYTFNSIFTELHAQPQKADVQQAFSVIFWTMTWMSLSYPEVRFDLMRVLLMIRILERDKAGVGNLFPAMSVPESAWHGLFDAESLSL